MTRPVGLRKAGADSPPQGTTLKNFFRNLHQFVKGTNGTHAAEPEPLDLDAEVEVVRAAEAAEGIEPGKRIHSFVCEGLELRLDQDVVGQYRVTAWEGRERRYSFTVHCEAGNYAALRRGFEEIAHFLQSDRRLAHLPDDTLLKGHFYGSV